MVVVADAPASVLAVHLSLILLLQCRSAVVLAARHIAAFPLWVRQVVGWEGSWAHHLVGRSIVVAHRCQSIVVEAQCRHRLVVVGMVVGGIGSMDFGFGRR